MGRATPPRTPLQRAPEVVYCSSCTEREQTGPQAWETAGQTPEVGLLRSTVYSGDTASNEG